PGQIALVVIIREQRIRAKPKEICKRRVGADSRRLPQRSRRFLEFGAVELVIGNADQFLAAPANHSVRVIDLAPLGGLSLDILLDALARESWRIERAAGRHRL